MTISNLVGYSKIMIVYGLAYAGSFVLYSLYRRIKIPPEIFLYIAWVLWAVTGFFIAENMLYYKSSLFSIIQMSMLIYTVAGITIIKKDISPAMISILSGCFIISLLSLYSGDFSVASNVDEKIQAGGIVDSGNPNAFSYYMLFFIFSIIFFFQDSNRIKKVIFTFLFILALTAIIYSGSRKGFLGILAFIIILYFFNYGKKIIQKPILTIFVFTFIFTGTISISYYVLTNTYLGKRFLFEEERTSDVARIQMYQDGLRLVFEKPLTGVGLNNYRVHSTMGKVSHSDYMEVAANTGIIGFILYFSIYIVLWRRLAKIKSITKDQFVVKNIRLIQSAIITILLLAFGRPNIIDKITWIFLAAVIGYSWALEKHLCSKSNKYI